jgi:hypothetical protein
MNMPGFTAEASLEKTGGHYHSAHAAHAYAEAGGNALHPAQHWEFCDWRCFWNCQGRCPRVCGSDRECLWWCREFGCYEECNCLVP